MSIFFFINSYVNSALNIIAYDTCFEIGVILMFFILACWVDVEENMRKLRERGNDFWRRLKELFPEGFGVGGYGGFLSVIFDKYSKSKTLKAGNGLDWETFTVGVFTGLIFAICALLPRPKKRRNNDDEDGEDQSKNTYYNNKYIEEDMKDELEDVRIEVKNLKKQSDILEKQNEDMRKQIDQSFDIVKKQDDFIQKDVDSLRKHYQDMRKQINDALDDMKAMANEARSKANAAENKTNQIENRAYTKEKQIDDVFDKIINQIDNAKTKVNDTKPKNINENISGGENENIIKNADK